MTSIEWLNEQMNNIKGSSISMNGRVQFIEKELNRLLEQAKQMEKEQSLTMSDYNLDELADEYYKKFDNLPVIRYNAYVAGFQKALELLTFKSE